MNDRSAADLVAGSQSAGNQSIRTAAVSRRQFLRKGALTVAGVTAISSAELFLPSRSLAQSGGVVFGFKFYNNNLLMAMPLFDDEDRLRLCRHVYEFNYLPATAGQGVPDVLPATYRFNGSTPNYLEPLVQASPFQSVAEYQDLLNDQNFGNDLQGSFPPPPGIVGPNEEIGPKLVTTCRSVQRNSDGQSFHVVDWCCFYSNPDRVIGIYVGNTLVKRYNVRDANTVPGAPQEVKNYQPRLVNLWTARDSLQPFKHSFFYSLNTVQAGTATAAWDQTLNADPNAVYNLQAYIPTLSGWPLTQNAQYLVTHQNGQSLVKLDQLRATRPWAPLVNAQGQVARFRFGTGSYEVRLLSDTGENLSSTYVIADGIRWLLA